MCFLSLSRPIGLDTSRKGLWPRRFLCKLIHFIRQQSRSPCVWMARGGSRFSVRMQWPSLAADGLHYIRTAFQFKTKRQHCCEMDYSQQRWIHFVAAVVPDEASGFPLPAVKWCLALPWVLPREVIVHWSDLQAHYLPVFHPKEPGVLSMIYATGGTFVDLPVGHLAEN